MNLKELFVGKESSRAITDIRYGYSLDSFRSNPSNVSTMARFLRSDLGRSIMSVLHYHTPRGYPLRGGATVESAALEHMRREGHEGAVMLLEAMAKDAPASNETIREDWGVVEPEEDRE